MLYVYPVRSWRRTTNRVEQHLEGRRKLALMKKVRVKKYLVVHDIDNYIMSREVFASKHSCIRSVGSRRTGS